MDQASRAKRFSPRSHASGTFVIANCWDERFGARAGLAGFAALAHVHGAAAGVLGRLDHGITLEESLANARLICDSTDLPVSARSRERLRRCPCRHRARHPSRRGAGLVGGSIEDATGHDGHAESSLTVWPPNASPPPSKRRARYLSRSRSPRAPRISSMAARPGRHHSSACKPTTRRCATCCSRPALPDARAVRTVCASVSRPVNFMVGIPGQVVLGGASSAPRACAA
jgi:hypothetical protein